MQTISIILKDDIDEKKRQELLARVAEQKSCESVSAPRPSSKSSLARRLCYARVENNEFAEALRKFIATQPEVEVAEIEPRRKPL